jgi:hypothetical protein
VPEDRKRTGIFPNLAMCEDYNSPGSPYWALKTLLILALEEDHPFWQAQEQPLPPLAEKHAIPHAQQILIHAEQSQHATLLTAGQLELNNYVNTEAKYTKFALSPPSPTLSGALFLAVRCKVPGRSPQPPPIQTPPGALRRPKNRA